MKTTIILNKSFQYALLVFIILIIPFSVLFFMTPKQIVNYTVEDGLIENLSAIYYFIASVVCFYIFIKFSNQGGDNYLTKNRNYFILFLGIFLFICFGEEISWGQRIFGFTTSNSVKAINVQGETNFHNLIYIDGRDSHGVFTKKGIAQFSTIDGIFILIWFFYCFIIPIINRLSSKFNNFARKIHFPIIPVCLGVIFVLHQFFYEIFKSLGWFPIKPLSEIKEMNVAFLYLLASISIYLKYKIENSKEGIMEVKTQNTELNYG